MRGEAAARDVVASRKELVAGQRPRVAVLACADSRVAPEIIFDAGLGEVFVVRVAGAAVGAGVVAEAEALRTVGADGTAAKPRSISSMARRSRARPLSIVRPGPKEPMMTAITRRPLRSAVALRQ